MDDGQVSVRCCLHVEPVLDVPRFGRDVAIASVATFDRRQSVDLIRIFKFLRKRVTIIPRLSLSCERTSSMKEYGYACFCHNFHLIIITSHAASLCAGRINALCCTNAMKA